MIEQRYADLFANGAQVPLEIAEREIALTYILKILLETQLLRSLAFKGGTALRKCVYGKETRFSLDLDFTCTDHELDPEELILQLVETLTKPAYGMTFAVKTKDFYVAEDRSSCGAVIRYRHDWHEAFFKLEISLREQPTLPIVELPLKKQTYFKYLDFPVFSIPCLQFEELLAEKIRAASQRIRARDLYDLTHAARKPFDQALVRSLVVLKCWNVRDVFDPPSFFKKIQSSRYNWDDLKQLVRRSEKISPDRLIKTCHERYEFLNKLTPEEAKVVADARRHRLKCVPESLLKSHRSKIVNLKGWTD